MKGVLLKTVGAAIDATGNVDHGTMVGVRYVNSKGEIKEMQVSKRVSLKKKKRLDSSVKKSQPNRKVSALIPILDHSDFDKPKDLFLFSIIGFDPDGDLSEFYPIIRGNERNLD